MHNTTLSLKHRLSIFFLTGLSSITAVKQLICNLVTKFGHKVWLDALNLDPLTSSCGGGGASPSLKMPSSITVSFMNYLNNISFTTILGRKLCITPMQLGNYNVSVHIENIRRRSFHEWEASLITPNARLMTFRNLACVWLNSSSFVIRWPALRKSNNQ